MAEKKTPRLPRNLKSDLVNVDSLLTDISAKISSMGSADNMFTVRVNVDGLDKFADIEKRMKSVAVVNKTLAKNLGDLAKTTRALAEKEKVLNTELLKHVTLQDELEGLFKKKSVADAKGIKLTDEQIDRIKQLVKTEDGRVESIMKVRSAQMKVEQQTGSLDSATQVYAKTLAGQAVSAVNDFGTALVMLALDAVVLSFELLWKGITKVYDLFERTQKAVGSFNLSMGGTMEGLAATRQEAFKVEGQLRALTGGALGIGLKMWEETSHALGFVSKGFDQMSTDATLAGRALGIGSTAAGELTRTFWAMGESQKSVTSNMVLISDAANAAGVSVADFGKEVNASRGIMTRFGKDGKKVFLDSAAFAKKLGLSLQGLKGFIDLTDTFESTAQAASKLNMVFGTSINSLDLMLEQDPSKRLEMVRSAIKGQAIEWGKLMPQQRKFFADTLHLSEEEANAVMESNMTLEEFQKKQAAAAKSKVSDEEKIRRGLAKTAETLFNWGQNWDVITGKIAKLIKPFLDVLGISDRFEKNGKKMGLVKSMFVSLGEFIEKLAKDPAVQDMMKRWATSFSEFVGKVQKFVGKDKDGLGDWVKNAMVGVDKMLTSIQKIATVLVEKVFTDKNIEKAQKIFDVIAENIDKIVGGFLLLKGAMVAVSVGKGVKSMFDFLSTTKPGSAGGNVGSKVAEKEMGLFAKAVQNGRMVFADSIGGATGFKQTVGVFRQGLNAAANTLVGNFNSLGGGVMKTAGQAAVLAGTFYASYEATRFFMENVKVFGKSLDEWVQFFADGIGDFFNRMWRSFKDSSLGKALGLHTNVKEYLDKGGLQETTAMKMIKTLDAVASGTATKGQINAIQDISKGNEKDFATAISKFSEGSENFSQQRVLDLLEKSKTMKGVEGPRVTPVSAATPMSATQAPFVGGTRTTGTQTEFAPAKVSKKEVAGKEIVFVAGDVFLNSDRVGSVLLRDAVVKGT